MKFLTRSLSFLLAVLCIQACGGDMDILEEDSSAPIRMTDPVIDEVRRGPDLGLRLKTRLKGHGPGAPPCAVRCTVRDDEDHVLANPTLLETGFESHNLDSLGILQSKHDSAFVSEQAVVFGWPLGNAQDPMVEVFIPYHYMSLVSGDQEIHLDLEVLEGEPAGLNHNDLPKVIRECKELSRVGYKKVAYRFGYPDLHSVRIWVESFELDTTLFDPHIADVSLFKLRSDHGYPDVCWTIGVDYEIVFQSDFFKNSLNGTWKWPSDPIYVDGMTERIRICAMDWDDERFFKNQDDALACWEGRIMALSDDPDEPSILNFEMVSNLKVSVLWDGALPEVK